jgi:alginate export protein
MRAQPLVRACVALSIVCAIARPAVAQQPAQPPQPVPLALNGQLAQWLELRGEFRARTEEFDGGGFSATNEDAYWLDRFRFNATVKPSRTLTFFVQAQDARAFNKRTGGTAAPFRDTISVRQAYGESAIGSKTMVRIGRQELAFGEQRLLGALGWANVARSFDAARLTVKQPFGQLDAFAASVVTITPDGFDKSGGGNALYGTYESLTTLIPKQVVEPYFLVRRSPNLHHGTAGIRVAGRLPSAFDYSTEAVIQRGSTGADDLRSWAGHALVGRSFGALLKPRAFGEFNYASATFDQMYPTGHDKFGLADQIGWRNIRHLRAGVEVKPTTTVQIATSFHDYWLADAAGGLYSASGARVARSLTGTAGTHVGREIDIQTAYVYSAQLQIAGGYAYLAPGKFLRNTTAGHGYSYPFVMATYVFLGESPTVGGRKTK